MRLDLDLVVIVRESTKHWLLREQEDLRVRDGDWPAWEA